MIERPHIIRPGLEEAALYGQGLRVRRRGRWWVLPRGERVLPKIAGAAGIAPMVDASLGFTVAATASVANPCLAAAPKGHLIVAAGGITGFTGTVTSQSISDSASNPYTSAAASLGVGGSAIEMAACAAATALSTSSTITYAETGGTVNISTGSFSGGATFANCAPDAATRSYASATNGGTGSTVSITSGSVKEGDLVVAVLFVLVTGLFAAPAGWSLAVPFGGGAPTVSILWTVAPSTGTMSISQASGASSPWAAAIAAFPAAAPVQSAGSANNATPTVGSQLPGFC